MGRITGLDTDTLKKKMLEALAKTGGVIVHATQIGGVSGNEHRKWLREDPAYKLACEEFIETSIDEAESILWKHMRGDDAKVSLDACKFYLARKGKNHGWNLAESEARANLIEESITFRINGQDMKIGSNKSIN